MAQQFNEEVEISDGTGNKISLRADRAEATFRQGSEYAMFTHDKILIGLKPSVSARDVGRMTGAAIRELIQGVATEAVMVGADSGTAQTPGAIISVGTKGNSGAISVAGEQNSGAINVDGASRTINIAGENNITVIKLDGSTNTISITGDDGQESILINGRTGDIELLGADCAEEFDIEQASLDFEPGDVMVIGDSGALARSQMACDRRVAGVVSGAGDYHPGIILHKKRNNTRRAPLALSGKVFCKVDASFGAINAGDLLTTAPTLGHAMRVQDPMEAFGAIVGKALKPLGTGTGLIPIVVALQ